MITTISAYIFLIATIFVILFQLGLAFGMPWGEYAMGGKFPGKFPIAMRIAALVQILILIIFATTVLINAQIILPEFYKFSQTAIWFVLAFSILGSVLNIITKSKKERMIWAPVSIILLISVVLVMLKI